MIVVSEVTVTMPRMIYRSSARTVPVNYTDMVKRLRRLLRPYSVHAIIDACIEVLDKWRGTGLDELKSAPWLTLLIVKLVLEDRSISLRGTKPCPTALIDEIRNDLWNTPDAREHEGSPSIYLMFRSLVHTQFLFQQAESFSFLRWPALISRLPPEHALRGQFEAEFGCDPDTFIGVVFAAYSAVMQGKTFITLNYWEPLRPLYGSAIDRFLDRFAKDATDLRKLLVDELHRRVYTAVEGRKMLRPDAAARPESERIEFPWVSRFPFFRHASSRLAVWHRLVFARGMEDGVHNVLSSLGQAYTDPFSKIFEGYVVELIRNSGLDFVSEHEIKGGVASRPAVEALVHADSCNVFIESKMSLFPDRVLISDRGPEIFMKMRRIREGMVQGWRVGEMLRDGTVQVDGASNAEQDFLLIVTSRQLNVCSGEHFKRMFGEDVIARINPESKFVGPTALQLDRLPLKNIFVLSIEEFEHLTSAIAEGSVDLIPLLKAAALKNADPVTSSMHFDQILSTQVNRWTHSRLIRATRLRIERQLRGWLNGTEPSSR